VNDIVIGTVVQRFPEIYNVDINAPSMAELNSIEFEGATKKNKPNLTVGTAIFCRILAIDTKIRLTCISPLHKKAWTTKEAFFGPLDNGWIEQFPIRFVRNLMGSRQDILQKIGEHIAFDVQLGFNGRVWFNAKRREDVVFVRSVLRHCAEGGDIEKSLERLR